MADLFLPTNCDAIRFLKDKNHKLAITAVVVSPDSRFLFSASKDSGLLKWDLSTGEKLEKIPGGKRGKEASHKGHCTVINALAISSDGKFLASGDDSKLIHVWNVDTMDLYHTFKGHRDPITGLAFRKKTHSLFSCSADRAVKIWSIDDKTYVETL